MDVFSESKAHQVQLVSDESKAHQVQFVDVFSDTSTNLAMALSLRSSIIQLYEAFTTGFIF